MQAERFKPSKESAVVTDLDAILESPGTVRLHGVDHTIKPVLVGEFFTFANALAGIEGIAKSEKVTIDQIINGYYEIIFPIVPSITREDIRKCSQSQVAALVNLVQLHVTGKLTDEKKKNLMLNPESLVKQ